MAVGFKTGGKDIKKGETLNPNGRPAMDEDTKRLKKMTKAHFNDVAQKYLLSTIGELNAQFANKNTPALDMILIKVLVEAVKKGDVAKLNFILERTIGKVQDKLDITSRGQQLGAPDLEQLDVDELKELRRLTEKCQN